MRADTPLARAEPPLCDHAADDGADVPNVGGFSADELLALFASSLEKRAETAQAARLLALSEYAALARRLAGWALQHAELTTAAALLDRAQKAEGRAAVLREPFGLVM